MKIGIDAIAFDVAQIHLPIKHLQPLGILKLKN